ncbi:L-cystine transport system permease protein TcyL [Halomonas elongata]|uniref:L-cystine transport system permease protein TcyL n=1 Tax=Halomonas elongata TaxID=2746 RepID=A0A1B8P5G1_HALEL|nr:L-cystine transport system permease protein TcyL [Halomonas elongata]
MNVLDFDYMLGLVPILLSYLPLTLEMAAAGMALALVLACGLAVIRVLKIPGLNAATMLFISFFRGTPCWCSSSCSITACPSYWTS